MQRLPFKALWLILFAVALSSTGCRTILWLDLTKTGRVSGVLLFDGQPVRARIWATPVVDDQDWGQLEAYSDSAGQFSFDLPQGTFRIDAHLVEDESVYVCRRVHSQEDREVDLGALFLLPEIELVVELGREADQTQIVVVTEDNEFSDAEETYYCAMLLLDREDHGVLFVRGRNAVIGVWDKDEDYVRRYAVGLSSERRQVVSLSDISLEGSREPAIPLYRKGFPTLWWPWTVTANYEEDWDSLLEELPR